MRGFALLLLVPLSAFGKAWCELPNGTGYYAETCPQDAKTKPVASDSEIAAARQLKEKAASDGVRRDAAWKKLCEVDGFTYWKSNNSCVLEHGLAFMEMDKILQGNDERAANKAAACALRWYRTQLDVVDAKMWRYCYFH